MNSYLRRLGITLAFLGFASVLPATAGAQPPVYLTQWGSSGSGDGQFGSGPSGVATDAAGNVYVVDAYNYRVQKFSGTGTFLTKWGSLGDLNGQFEGVLGVATDAGGDVYVTDQINGVQRFTGTGAFVIRWGSFGFGIGEFYFPVGVATDAAGNVYVADTYNNRIQKFTNTGAYLTQWGTSGSGNGEFFLPNGVATDAAGDVYVVDVYNDRIQKFSSSGVYITQWGSAGSDTSADGRLNRPSGVATDAAGNVYVADAQNQRVQKFTGTGTFLTKWGSFGSGNGQFNYPVAVATDAAGNIYVSDNGNSRIQKFGPGSTPPLTVAFDFTPSTLNLTARGLWVAGLIEPPSPFDAGDIDIASLRLNGTVQAGSAVLGDGNDNGVPDLTVQFSRTAVGLTVPQGDNVPIIVTGTLAGHSFSGTDYIHVIRAAGSASLAGGDLEADDGSGQLGLRAATRNPAQDELRVSFRLPNSKPASLALFDVSGRQLAARRVDEMGPGWHMVQLGERSNIPAGLYIIRLTQDGRSLTTRAAAVR